MATNGRSKSAGPKPPRVVGKAIATKTHTGTTQTMVFYACESCGSQHRCNEFGLRVTACHSGLVFVVAGGIQ